MPARRRNYQAEQQRRNLLARRFGFRSYWERRQAGQHGAFLRFIRPGDLIQLDEPLSTVQLDERGRYREIRKYVDPDNPSRGDRVFTIRNLTRRQLRLMIDEELRLGGILTAQPSLDQRRLLTSTEET